MFKDLSARFTAAFPVDVDGDGDLDVAGASENTNTVAWWENTGDYDGIWTEHNIDVDFAEALYVDAADLDGDGDNDVLCSARAGDEIAWWESDCAQ